MALTADQLEAWRLFLQAHTAVTDVLERELSHEEDLALTWYDVLVQLSEAPDQRLRMQELASTLMLSRSGVTRLVDRIEQAGLVTRERCPDDGRGTWTVLTPAGLSRLEQTHPTHARGVQQHFASVLSAGETRTLARALRKVVAACTDTPDPSDEHAG